MAAVAAKSPTRARPQAQQDCIWGTSVRPQPWHRSGPSCSGCSCSGVPRSDRSLLVPNRSQLDPHFGQNFASCRNELPQVAHCAILKVPTSSSVHRSVTKLNKAARPDMTCRIKLNIKYITYWKGSCHSPAAGHHQPMPMLPIHSWVRLTCVGVEPAERDIQSFLHTVSFTSVFVRS